MRKVTLQVPVTFIDVHKKPVERLVTVKTEFGMDIETGRLWAENNREQYITCRVTYTEQQEL